MAYFRVIVHYYIRYFKRYKSPGVTMLDPYPRVILVPGVGLFTTGKDRRAGREGPGSGAIIPVDGGVKEVFPR